jgi:hypothetical protein
MDCLLLQAYPGMNPAFAERLNGEVSESEIISTGKGHTERRLI